MRPADVVWEHSTVASVVATEGDGPWWIACEYAERSADRWTIWCWTCTACMIHLQVAAARWDPHVDGTHSTIRLDGVRRDGMALPDVLAQAMEWRREHLTV
jgi:hypothetical protein